MNNLQRVVCGRNMSTDQLFSNGGQANSFDQLRDQLKEKDEEVLYLYDNSTSRECNDVMRGLEENRDDGVGVGIGVQSSISFPLQSFNSNSRNRVI